MSNYIVFNHIQVQNANCVAGLTYGFPAITQFLGYIHALSRKLQQSHSISLDGCAIICHQHQAHVHQPKGWGDYVFAQTRNPLTRLGETPPIIEEGRMHLTVSLVTECKGFDGGEAQKNAFEEHLVNLCQTQKLAGGIIKQIKQVVYEPLNTDKDFWRLRRQLMPGFVLLDRTEYLAEHFQELQTENPKAEMVDAWLDFTTLKFQAEPLLTEGQEITAKTKARWQSQQGSYSGWLVPITTGYLAISEVYAPGKVPNARDATVPFCFVEAAYGIGEWQSTHRIKKMPQILWNYTYQDGCYICQQQSNIKEVQENDDIEENIFGFICE